MPHVTFSLNKALDKKVIEVFLNVSQGGIVFSRGLVSIHPTLKKAGRIRKKSARQKFIADYTDSFYSRHGEYLKNRVKKFMKEWNVVETSFFKEARTLFKGHPFPKGKYIGYPSIVDCNPRFLNNKTFQVFYRHPLGVNYVTAHELLHFAFYDYAIKKYPKLFKNTNTEEGPFWDLAEIFNAVILHTPQFVNVHKIQKRILYPEHSKFIRGMMELWGEYQDVDKFIECGWNILQNSHLKFLKS